MNTATYYETAERLANELLIMLDRQPKTRTAHRHSIGIGVTTSTRPDRMDILNKTVLELERNRPSGCRMVIVDDESKPDLRGSDFVRNFTANEDNEYYRFDANVGIARAKNKCFELLQDCDHIFLFDDDTFPLRPDWYLPYCESQENHLMYIFTHFKNSISCGDITEVYRDDKIRAFTHVRGCMLYYKRVCLDVVGGMDAAFGKWGNEHGDLSNRIFNAGLTTFRYMDIADSSGYFYSGDEHQSVISTFVGVKRDEALAASKAIYEQQFNSAAYREYREKENLLLTTYFVEVKDPQRGMSWPWKPEVLRPLLTSATSFNHKVAVIHNNANSDIEGAINVKAICAINPYFQRWVSYYQYLRANKDKIGWAFCVDATDVELLNRPNPKRGKIYIGYEMTDVNCEWMCNNHSDHVFNQFYRQFSDSDLLNAGVVGGYVEDLLPFIKAIINCYCDLVLGQARYKQEGPGVTDMGVLNLVAYTQFQDKIVTGNRVTTAFKQDERNTYSWFKHK